VHQCALVDLQIVKLDKIQLLQRIPRRAILDHSLCSIFDLCTNSFPSVPVVQRDSMVRSKGSGRCMLKAVVRGLVLSKEKPLFPAKPLAKSSLSLSDKEEHVAD